MFSKGGLLITFASVKQQISGNYKAILNIFVNPESTRK